MQNFDWNTRPSTGHIPTFEFNKQPGHREVVPSHNLCGIKEAAVPLSSIDVVTQLSMQYFLPFPQLMYFTHLLHRLKIDIYEAWYRV